MLSNLLSLAPALSCKPYFKSIHYIKYSKNMEHNHKSKLDNLNYAWLKLKELHILKIKLKCLS